ncbi:hypothetical protein AAMO2058_001056000, partial [Amorphochlora amoebiformis]
MSFWLQKREQESTTVEIAHTASLTSPKHINLVVSTCTSLNIYSLCHSSKPTQSVSGGEDKGDAKGKGEQQSRLVLMEEFPLLDKLEAFEVIRLPGDSVDSLAMTFAPAKLSIVRFNADTQTLTTLALRALDGPESMKEASAILTNPPPPLLAKDPENRCICVVALGGNFVFYPLRRPEG